MHVRVDSIEHALRASEPSVEPINDTTATEWLTSWRKTIFGYNAQ
jgi:hypothetical protein